MNHATQDADDLPPCLAPRSARPLRMPATVPGFAASPTRSPFPCAAKPLPSLDLLALQDRRTVEQWAERFGGMPVLLRHDNDGLSLGAGIELNRKGRDATYWGHDFDEVYALAADRVRRDPMLVESDDDA